MNRPTCAVMVLAGLAAGCELVAGIQDKYLSGSDASGPSTGPPETGSILADDSTDAGGGRQDAATNDPGPLDAPQGAVDAPVIDPPKDANAPPTDATGPGGGNFTPPDAGTTDPSAPCSGQPAFLFCDDFDTESTISQGWEYALSSIDGGSISFFAGAYTSPSRSLQVVAPPAPSPYNELLGIDLGSLTGPIRLAFDLRIDMDSLASLPTTAIAQILGSQAAKMELDYLIRPTQGAVLEAYVSQDGGPRIDIALPAPPLRTWTRIVIVYDGSAGITIYEDGVQIGASAAAAAGAPKDTKIQMGMIYGFGSGTATLQLEMDNIVIRGH